MSKLIKLLEKRKFKVYRKLKNNDHSIYPNFIPKNGITLVHPDKNLNFFKNIIKLEIKEALAFEKLLGLTPLLAERMTSRLLLGWS